MIMMTIKMMMMMEMRAIVHLQVPVIHAVQVVLGGASGGARFFTFLEDSHGPGDHDHGGQDNKGNGVFCIRICYKLCAHLNLLEIWQFTKFTVSLSSLSRVRQTTC